MYLYLLISFNCEKKKKLLNGIKVLAMFKIFDLLLFLQLAYSKKIKLFSEPICTDLRLHNY